MTDLQLAKAKDQLVPLLVMDTLSTFPGVPGMFVAGVFSAALSSLSTGLNSLAAVFLEDYIKPLYGKPMSERLTGVIMRVCTVVIGTMSVALVFVVERMGTHVVQLFMTLSSVTQGPLMTLFIAGLLCPRINTKVRKLFQVETDFSLMFILVSLPECALRCLLIVYLHDLAMCDGSAGHQ